MLPKMMLFRQRFEELGIPRFCTNPRQEQVRWETFASEIDTEEIAEFVDYIDAGNLDHTNFIKLFELPYALARIKRNDATEIIINKLLSVVEQSGRSVSIDDIIKLVNRPWAEDHENRVSAEVTRRNLLRLLDIFDKRQSSDPEKYAAMLWLSVVEDFLGNREKAKEIFPSIEWGELTSDFEELYSAVSQQLTGT